MRISLLPTHLTHESAICIITRRAWETHIIKPPPLLIKVEIHTAGNEDFRWCVGSFKGQTLPQVSPQQQTLPSHFFAFFFFFWRIIALQNFIVFCQTSTWLSHRYTYIPSLLNIPPHLPPRPTPLGWYRAPVCVSWAIQQIPIGYLFYI